MFSNLRSLGRKVIDRIRVYIFILNARSCFPELQSRAITRIDEGKDNYTLEFNHKLILQTPRRKEDCQRMIFEYRLLNSIKDRFDIKIPEPLYFSDGTGACKTVLIGYSKIEGVGVDIIKETSTNIDSLSTEIAEFLKKLHAVPQEVLIDPISCNGKDMEYSKKHKEAINFFRRKGAQIINAQNYKFIGEYLESVESEIAAENGCKAIIHHDLRTEHILIDPGTGKVSGVVDWMDGCIGDPSEDFAFILRDLGHDFYRKVVKQYGVPSSQNLAKKSYFYSLLSFFNDIVSYYGRDAIRTQDLIDKLYYFLDVMRNDPDLINFRK